MFVCFYLFLILDRFFIKEKNTKFNFGEHFSIFLICIYLKNYIYKDKMLLCVCIYKF